MMGPVLEAGDSTVASIMNKAEIDPSEVGSGGGAGSNQVDRLVGIHHREKCCEAEYTVMSECAWCGG